MLGLHLVSMMCSSCMYPRSKWFKQFEIMQFTDDRLSCFVSKVENICFQFRCQWTQSQQFIKHKVPKKETKKFEARILKRKPTKLWRRKYEARTVKRKPTKLWRRKLEKRKGNGEALHNNRLHKTCKIYCEELFQWNIHGSLLTIDTIREPYLEEPHSNYLLSSLRCPTSLFLFVNSASTY